MGKGVAIRGIVFIGIKQLGRLDRINRLLPAGFT